ncbi:ATP-binding protein [Cohnella zeiphila]|uniref:ATP-binding protein n=1 Tax=Cohnella zeiphila TaxID=2761120 RepID=A0A7X0VXJ9_9BACL|nr:ATP-binding protein [Cohnella zeiphila]MBB6734091.1 ATP-binding protein [Cohnella zeiphila]
MDQVVLESDAAVEAIGETPYPDGTAHVKGWLEWLDAGIALMLHRREKLEKEFGTAADAFVTGTAGGSEEEGTERELFVQWERARNRAEQATRLGERENAFLPLPYLARLFGLSALETRIVIVCLAVEVDRKYESAFALLQGERSATYPSRDLLASLAAGDAAERRTAVRILREEGLLARYFLREAGGARKGGTTLNRYCRLDDRIVRFALDSAALPEAMARYMTIVPPASVPEPLLGHFEIQDKLRSWMTRRAATEEASLVVSLWGNEGAGKRTHVAHLGVHFNEALLYVDMAKLPEDGPDGPDALDAVFREAAIQQAIPVFCGFLLRSDGEAEKRRKQDLLERLSRLPGIAFLLSEEPCGPIDRRGVIELELEIPGLRDEERAEAWRTLSLAYEIEDGIDWEALSSRFLFNPGQMASAMAAARASARWRTGGDGHERIGWSDLIQACYKQISHNLSAKSKRLSPKQRWADLVLPEAQTRKLQHACHHIRYKHNVYGTWGFQGKLSYGTGISLLFSGPPGTGKTMAAEVAANELDMEIYKIDLSQMISKYIGETEKNLREIFDEAQSSYAILFFDEADALFGKRSEVKDAHDKNANTEVAYLLQKMEEYRGISILATNYLQNMDEAFLRRINYVIRFPMPDEKQREAIWRNIFPRQTPLASDLDCGFLGRKLQLSGGSIKNVALTAAFLASGEGEAVGMKHIFQAYQYELDKTNRTLTRDDLGEYAYYFEEIRSI